MFDEHRRPWGRLFYLLAFVWVGVVVGTDCADDHDDSETLFIGLTGRWLEGRC